MRRGVVAVAGLVALGALPWGTAQGTEAGTSRPRLPAAVVEAAYRLTGDTPMRQMAAHAVTDEPPDRYAAYPVHDVDGDGFDDVLDIRYSRDASPTWTTIARNGRTGERLWRHTTDDRLSLWTPARVGTAGANGFVRLDYDADPVTFEVRKYRLTGVSGDGGEDLWSFDLPRNEMAAGPVELWPRTLYFGGLMGRGPGKPVEVVLSDTRAVASSVLGGISLWTIQPVVVSGGDGAVRDGGPAITQLGTFTPTVSAVGDLTGDDEDDFVVMLSGPPDNPGAAVVEARAGDDGETLWTTRGVRFGGYSRARSAAEMTGDRIDEVVIDSSGSLGGGGIYISPVMTYPGMVQEGVVLLEGSEGEQRWHHDGYAGIPLGDVNRDGRGELLVLRSEQSNSGRRIVLHGGAYAGFGEVRWKRVLDVFDVPPEVGNDFGLYSDAYRAGDVQPDGVVDLVRQSSARTDSYFDEHTAIVDGRTGLDIRRDHQGAPYHASIDGRGDDFSVVVDDGDGGFSIVSEDGLTGAEIWRVRVDRPVDLVWTVGALRLDADACYEVVASVHDGDETSDAFAFRGTDAAPLWSLRRGRGSDTDISYPQHPVVGKAGCGAAPAAAPKPAPRPAPHRPAPPAAEPRGTLPATGGATPLLAVAIAALAAAGLRSRCARS